MTAPYIARQLAGVGHDVQARNGILKEPDQTTGRVSGSPDLVEG
jgi:hypothetical protein